MQTPNIRSSLRRLCVHEPSTYNCSLPDVPFTEQNQNCGWTERLLTLKKKKQKKTHQPFVCFPSQLQRHQRLFAPTPVCPRITWNSQHYLAGSCNTTPASAVRRFHRNSCWRMTSLKSRQHDVADGVEFGLWRPERSLAGELFLVQCSDSLASDWHGNASTGRQTPGRRHLPPSSAAFPTLTPGGRWGERWVVGLTS